MISLVKTTHFEDDGTISGHTVDASFLYVDSTGTNRQLDFSQFSDLDEATAVSAVIDDLLAVAEPALILLNALGN